MISGISSLAQSVSAAMLQLQHVPLHTAQATPAAQAWSQPTSAQPVAFNVLARGTDPLPLDDDVALLSMDVGQKESAGPDDLNGWTRVQTEPEGFDMPPGGQMDANGVIHGPDGLQAAIYMRGDDVIVVFAGSGVTSHRGGWDVVMIPGPNGTSIAVPLPRSVIEAGEDWLTNGRQVMGVDSPQHDFAMALAVEADETWPGQVVFGGHSLGGGLAAAASLATGAPAVTFNAAGLTDATINDAIGIRNGREGEARDSQYYLDDANSGGIRAYHTGNDPLTALQDGDHPRLPGDLPEAVGHPIQVADPGWSMMPDVIAPVEVVLMRAATNLLVEGHGIESAEAAVFANARSAVEVEGMTVTMLDPSRNSSGLGVGDMTLSAVTFADNPQGHEAMRVFMITGQLPPDMAGVASVVQTGTLPGSANMSESTRTHYNGFGLPTQGTSVIYEDGVEIAVISRVYDASGAEVHAERTYSYRVTPQTEGEARMLNQILFDDPDGGPIQVGETYTVRVGEAEMGELADTATGAEMLRPEYTAGMDENGGGDANTRFAQNLLTAHPEGLIPALAHLYGFRDGGDAIIDAEVIDADGNVLAGESGATGGAGG